MTNKYTKDMELDIINKYLSGETTVSIGKQYNTSHSSIVNILKRNDITLRDIYNKRSTLQCNRHFFEKIDSEIKAYWLGFIVADGHIDAHRIRIQLSVKDYNHLALFKKTINSEHKLAITKRKVGIRATFEVTSTEMANDIIKIGYGGNKTNFAPYPHFLSKELQIHFIRGLVDGDGCWTGHKFTCVAPINFAIDLQNFLMTNCNFKKTKLQIESENRKVASVIYGGRNQVRKIYKLLYENANIYLLRKKEAAEKITKHVDQRYRKL